MDLDDFLQSIMLAPLVLLSHIKPIGNMIDLNNKPQHNDGDTDGVEEKARIEKKVSLCCMFPSICSVKDSHDPHYSPFPHEMGLVGRKLQTDK